MSKRIEMTGVVSALAVFLIAGPLPAQETWWTKATSTWPDDLVQILNSA